MKGKRRVLMAAALSASLTFTAAVPGFAAESEAPADAAGSIELPGNLAEGAGELEQALGQAEAGTEGVTAKIEFSEAMQQLLSQSADGQDMSWLGSVTADVVATTGEDGSMDANVRYSLNDTPVLDGLFAYDAADSTIYFQFPQIKDQPFSMNLNDLFRQMTEQGQGSVEQGMEEAMGQLNLSPEDVQRLQSEATELFGSITSDEVSGFIGRYADTISSGVTVEDAGTAPVTAGSMSTDAALTTVSVQPEAMDQILQTSMTTLHDDELIVKIVGSDFAADLVNLLGSSTTNSGSAGNPVTGADLVAAYQQFLEENKDKVAGMPGFSLTYGTGPNGSLTYVELKLLFSGAEFEIFSCSAINDGTQNAFEFDLGQMIVQALSSSSDSSDGQSQPAVTGKTGLLAEGSVSGGKLNETVTIRYNDQAVFAVQLADWDVEKFSQGSLDGNIAASIDGTDVRLAFESAAPDAQSMSFLVNEQALFTVTAQERAADPSEVQPIDKASAAPIRSEEDLEAFLSDADPSQLLQALQDAGVPQELLDDAASEEGEADPAAEPADDAA